MLHIDIPTLEEFKALAQVRGETCVSLYLPTSPLGSNAKLNRTAFKDLAKDALSQLSGGSVDKRKIVAFEEQFDRLAGGEHNVQDEDKIRKLQRGKPDPVDSFWHYLSTGLAVLATSATLRTFRLPESPKPLAEVADRFHLTPLIRAMTSPHDIYVLALAEENVRLIHAFANFPPERLAGSRPAQERGGSDPAAVLSRTCPAPRTAEPRRREGSAAPVCQESRARHPQPACGTQCTTSGSCCGGASRVDVPFRQYVFKTGRRADRRKPGLENGCRAGRYSHPDS